MKPFTTLAVLVFSLVAILHLIRAILGWPVSVNGIDIPLWASGIGFVITAVLATMLWREGRR
ncbi:MAG: hypothetical protein V4488_26445 [Pseudomonadota bacterium]